jgi:hypothetical protein
MQAGVAQTFVKWMKSTEQPGVVTSIPPNAFLKDL